MHLTTTGAQSHSNICRQRGSWKIDSTYKKSPLQKYPILSKTSRRRLCRQHSSRWLYRITRIKVDKIRMVIVAFRMCILSILQSHGQSQRLILLRVIQKNNTCNLDLDIGIQIRSFREGWVWFLRYFYKKKHFCQFSSIRILITM